MDLLKHGMKGPMRPAPAVPPINVVNRYSPVTNWNDDPFGTDVFEPMPQYAQKKKPPPRPPPPKLSRQPDVPIKPSHFIRKPTVLSSLLSRKSKTTVHQLNSTVKQQTTLTDFNSEVDTSKMFPKCETRNVQTGALIDLSSPPSSPTFTTRSSSDGLSVDSFGSDATTSTNQHNILSGGNVSQPESGFEDDFDLFLNNRKHIHKEDTLDDMVLSDPFSPQPVTQRPPIMKKPVFSRDPYDVTTNIQTYPVLKGPTIIRAKPARPKPPENSAILKSTFGSSLPITSMNVNTTVPIQKVSSGFGDSFDSKPFNWDHDSSPEREPSPPMPTIPPPPPPPVTDDDLVWSEDVPDFLAENLLEDTEVTSQDTEPHAVALFDYYTGHEEDLCFSANSTIYLIRRVNDEWLCGRLRNGIQGLFPSNYVEIKVPLPNDNVPKPSLGVATALYDFEPVQPGDLRFTTGDTIHVMCKLNDEWYFGECNGLKGQFPSNYVERS